MDKLYVEAENKLPFFETPVAAAGANWLLLPPFWALSRNDSTKEKKKKKNPDTIWTSKLMSKVLSDPDLFCS